MESQQQLRPAESGPWSDYYAQWVPRKINGMIYEIMRESVPYIDAAFDKLVDLDGVLTVTGKSVELVEEIKEFMKEVRVNDLQKGLNVFQANWTGEALEQGFALAEYITDSERSGITRLTVADSKSIVFKRKGGELLTFQRDKSGERELNMSNILYYAIHTENTNPYGVPLMRSCESVADAFTKINHAMKLTWERFGDPSYSVVYKTNNKNDLQSRVEKIRKSLTSAIKAKSSGKSADFVHGIGINDSLDIKIIGADNQVLDLEIPVKATVEQIIAKTGLPPWVLGLSWSSTERQSDAQLGVLRADSITRQAPKLELLTEIVATHLRLKGRTWKKGDWQLEFSVVNLQDIVKLAQARFLNAQADYYDNVYGAGAAKAVGAYEVHHHVKKIHKSVDRGETRPIAWPELDKVEQEYQASIKSGFDKLYREVCRIIDVNPAKATDEQDDGLTAEQIAAITVALDIFISSYNPADPNAPLAVYYAAAVAQGLLKGADLLNSSAPELTIDLVANMVTALAETGFELLSENTRKFSRDRMIPYLTQALAAGKAPDTVARELRKEFDTKAVDWERLATSEMTMAAEKGKLAEFKERGIEQVHFKPAPDACEKCMVVAGVYAIDEAPVPVQDTHPWCRCTITPMVPAE